VSGEKASCFQRSDPATMVVHPFGQCSDKGVLSDLEDASLDGTELIRICGEYRIKLLWIATSSASSSYIKGVRTKGSSLNLIVTLDRRGHRSQTAWTSWFRASHPARRYPRRGQHSLRKSAMRRTTSCPVASSTPPVRHCRRLDSETSFSVEATRALQ